MSIEGTFMKNRNKETFESLDDFPVDVQEQIQKNIDAFEQAKKCQPLQILSESGISLPPAENLADEELAVKLWEIIHSLALLGMYLEFTDHLSDRELYKLLLEDVLQEETVIQSPTFSMNCHIDMVGSGNEVDNHIYLKYYADEKDRTHWAKDFPEDILPDHERLPFDRDRLLPKPSIKEYSVH
jgi:hypothetical protein